jgi:octaprenyl-diphosphate synthase
MRAVAASTASMARGEMIQTLCRNDLDVTEGRYLDIISQKTAALISCSCRVGAMLGTHHNGEVEGLTRYGQNLGMAFQITDDLLDITGQEDRLGKAPGSDVREGRLTLPFIHAMRTAERDDAQWMRAALRSGKADQDILRRLRDVVGRYRGIEYGQRKAREYAEACKQGLEVLPESESRRALTLLADYVVGRAS